MRRLPATGAALAVLLAGAAARAATIHVTPSDSFAKIEAAGPGDEVVVAPGTYAFRLYFTKQAPANAPIVIRAEDPANPPVWDLGSTLVEDAPGSYTAGDRGRGCWQFSSATNYIVESIVFTHCRTSTNNSAGIRYYGGTTGLFVRDCVFRDNDNGVTGGTQDSEATIEFSEFDHNGNTSASAPTHNMYIYGGTFTLRYSYVHDPAQAQNFHIRAKTATIEANWFARAASYMGDLMTDDDYAGGSTFEQSIVLRGNVFLQGATQQNTGQIFVLYNDTGATGLTLKAHLLFNTLVGDGGHAAFVHLSNADGTAMHADVDDNVIFGTTKPVLIENANAGTAAGTHNWMPTGVDPGPLAATVFSADPGFAGASNLDFRIWSGACIGAASSGGVLDLPDTEYWQNEKTARMYRVRASTHDIGAFESTTSGTPVGPYGSGAGDAGPEGGPDGSKGDSDAEQPGGECCWDDGSDNGTNGGAGSGSGCGCAVIGGDAAPLGGVAVIAIAAVGLRRRRANG